jgi:hypothetical protein
VLTVDFLEVLRRTLVFLGAEIIEAAVIELLDRLFDIVRIVVGAAAAGEAKARDGQSQPCTDLETCPIRQIYAGRVYIMYRLKKEGPGAPPGNA